MVASAGATGSSQVQLEPFIRPAWASPDLQHHPHRTLALEVMESLRQDQPADMAKEHI